MRGEGSAAGHKNDGLVGYPFGQAATLPVQVLRPGQLGGQRKSPPRGREASPNDAAVLQLVLNGIDHIGMRRGNSILKAAMLGRIQFERKLMALVLACDTPDDDGGHRAGITGESGHENEG